MEQLFSLEKACVKCLIFDHEISSFYVNVLIFFHWMHNLVYLHMFHGPNQFTLKCMC